MRAAGRRFTRDLQVELKKVIIMQDLEFELRYRRCWVAMLAKHMDRPLWLIVNHFACTDIVKSCAYAVC